MEDGSAFPLGKTNVVTLDMVDDEFPMVDDPTKVVSERAAHQGDMAVLEYAKKKTSVFFYDNGQPMNGVPNTGDILIWIDTITTDNGMAVFNLTDNHAVNGKAMFKSVSLNSVDTNYVDGQALYSKSSPVLSSDLKKVSIPITKETVNIVSVAGLNVVGSMTMPSAGSGVTVKLFLIGIAA